MPSYSSTTLSILSIARIFTIAIAFTPAPARIINARQLSSKQTLIAKYVSAGSGDTEDTEESKTPIPCLPWIGGSSFSGEPAKNTEVIRLDGTPHDVSHVGSERFELQYTCKVCETRNSHKVSRMGE